MTEVDDFLAHYGVKGMKWGVVRAKSKTETLTTKLKSGETLTLEGRKTAPIARGLSRIIPQYGDVINKQSAFSLKDPKGKKIGELYLVTKNKNELYVNWVEVDAKAQGKGYASAAMNASIRFAKDQGLSKVTLEVPGKSPDARHIYEKLGFVAGKQITNSGDMWGGLTEMELNLKPKKEG